MNFPKFWAQGRSGGFSAWRWSQKSVEEARTEAESAAARLAAMFEADQIPDQRYGYPNRPLRELVLRELRNPAGELGSVVTRNAYGCQVLNSARALFVDVDFPEPKPKAGLFGSLFGKKPPEPEDPTRAPLAKAAAWARSRPGWNWRIYRTRGGLRLLATHALFEPEDPVCEQVFTAVDADPLYRKLCHTQKCFRARLTPKPWRCKLPRVPSRWPFENGAEQQAFEEWDAKYQAASRLKATCRLMDAGSGPIHDELREIVALHDEMSRATLPELELA